MEKLEPTPAGVSPIRTKTRCTATITCSRTFVGASVEGWAPLVDGALGSSAIRVVYGAYIAAEKGRRVELDADGLRRSWRKLAYAARSSSRLTGPPVADE
jgi:hypothetical protein